MVFDLTAHPIDLLGERGGALVVTVCRGALGFLREDGEGRLQSVREIAGLGERLAHALLAVREERVEIVGQRLHFDWVRPSDAALTAVMNGGKSLAELRKRLQPARRHRDTE